MNQVVVTYKKCTTDLHAVTHQLYVNQWMTDVLNTAHIITHQLCVKIHYANPTES